MDATEMRKAVIKVADKDNLNSPLGCWLMSVGTGSCLGWVFLLIFPPLGLVVWGVTGLWGLVIFPILAVTGKLGKFLADRSKKNETK